MIFVDFRTFFVYFLSFCKSSIKVPKLLKRRSLDECGWHFGEKFVAACNTHTYGWMHELKLCGIRPLHAEEMTIYKARPQPIGVRGPQGGSLHNREITQRLNSADFTIFSQL